MGSRVAVHIPHVGGGLFASRPNHGPNHGPNPMVDHEFPHFSIYLVEMHRWDATQQHDTGNWKIPKEVQEAISHWGAMYCNVCEENNLTTDHSKSVS